MCKGNKKDNVTIIYTPWSNLKKDGSMAVGQVGFKDPKKVCSNGWIVQLNRLLTASGQTSTCNSKGESNREQVKQNQNREIPRLAARKRDSREREQK
jgi:hypothetical protein